MANMHKLPEDIVFDIFVRMPTKPLLKFRRLSKRWNRLISRHFMKSRSRRMILLFDSKRLHAIDNTSPGDDTVHSIKFPSPFKNLSRIDRLIILGTIKGIVLLLCQLDMILYNPLTGAFKTVPNLPSRPFYRSESYGFCHGTTVDDLKIVRIWRDPLWCDVFSLKNGSWSAKVKMLDWRFSIVDRVGTFINGFLYWMGLEEKRRFTIIALDVKEMVFSEIQILPPCQFLNSLGTSRGRLQGFVRSDSKYELWEMKELGSNEYSWSEVTTSDCLVGYVPLFIMDVGKIVMVKYENRKQVIVYDMLKDSYETYEFKAEIHPGSQAIEYVESLISPSKVFSSW